MQYVSLGTTNQLPNMTSPLLRPDGKPWTASDINNLHRYDDVDRDSFAHHHTLGSKKTQAAAGDHLHDKWIDYVPVLTQSSVVTKTVTYARYYNTGKTVTAQIKLAVTGTGTGSQPIVVSLPVGALQNGLIVGSGFVLDASVGFMYKGIVDILDATHIHAYWTGDTTPSVLGSVGMTAALASGDEVNMFAIYQVAL